MRNNWFIRLRIRFRNYRRNVAKKIEGQDVLNVDQQLGFDIFKIALQDEGNIRYYDAPNGANTSHIKYIVSKEYFQGKKDVDTFIIFDDAQDRGKMIVVNHEYKYNFEFPKRTTNIMNDIFDDTVRKDRKRMKEEILANITTSLTIVLTKLKEKMLESKKPLPK
jgi:hypothetical protein